MSIEVEGLKDTLRLLQKIDPTLRREFGKRIRQIAQPMVDEIEKVKPTGQRLPRGFQHNGRTGAGVVKKIKINTPPKTRTEPITAPAASQPSKGWRPSANAQVCTSEAPTSKACTTWSGRSWTIP